METRTKIHSTLFWSMLYISAFTFGGGFVIVTLMKRRFVDELGWISEAEMLDMTALAQSSPGAIAVNAAILMGWKMGGFSGMLVSVLATILPPMFLLSIISFFYAAFASNPYVSLLLQGMQAGVAAVIFDVSFDLAGKVLSKKQRIDLILLILSFICAFFLKINVIFIILGAAVFGIIRELINQQKEGQK